MTGHKSVSSLAIYQKVSDEEKLEMGSSLGQFVADSSNQNNFKTNNSENYEDVQLDDWNLDVDCFANKTPINNNTLPMSKTPYNLPNGFFNNCNIKHLHIHLPK